MKPVSIGGAGTEGGFQVAVKEFNQTVGLGMIGGGRLVSDVEKAAEVKPERGGKLRALVRGDDGGNTKAGDPGVNEGSSTICSGSG